MFLEKEKVVDYRHDDYDLYVKEWKEFTRNGMTAECSRMFFRTPIDMGALVRAVRKYTGYFAPLEVFDMNRMDSELEHTTRFFVAPNGWVYAVLKWDEWMSLLERCKDGANAKQLCLF